MAMLLGYHTKVEIQVTRVTRMVEIGPFLVPIWWKIGDKNRGQAFCLPSAYGWFLRGESGTFDKLVAYPSLSEDHFWLAGIIVELLPQAVDVLLQKAGIGDIF
jgi:hypothetical protein